MKKIDINTLKGKSFEEFISLLKEGYKDAEDGGLGFDREEYEIWDYETNKLLLEGECAWNFNDDGKCTYIEFDGCWNLE